MSSKVPVAMTLRAAARNAEDISKVRQIAADLGFEPTTAGKASLSFRVPQNRLQELCGREARAVPARKPGARDQGTPGGFEGDDLPVPAALAPYVEHLAVVPPATRMR